MTPNEWERYSRQIRFAGLGELGQERLLRAHVAIAGCGALGSFQAGALARAGVGKLRLIDRDFVELSNLQRQWLFDENDALQGLPKAVAAANHLRRVNSGCAIETVVADLTPANIEDVLEECDLILDGTDNFETRYLINDFAIARGIPWIYGAAVGSYGLSIPIVPGRTACLACIYPKPPAGVQATCETAGVLGPVTSIVASLQCADAMKATGGCGSGLDNHNGGCVEWENSSDRYAAHDEACQVCGERVFEHLQSGQRAPISLCGRNAVQIHERQRPVDLRRLGDVLAPLGDVRVNEFALRFFPSPYEMTIFPDGRAIIKGTTDIGVARSLYARYVGA